MALTLKINAQNYLEFYVSDILRFNFFLMWALTAINAFWGEHMFLELSIQLMFGLVLLPMIIAMLAGCTAPRLPSYKKEVISNDDLLKTTKYGIYFLAIMATGYVIQSSDYWQLIFNEYVNPFRKIMFLFALILTWPAISYVKYIIKKLIGK